MVPSSSSITATCLIWSLVPLIRLMSQASSHFFLPLTWGRSHHHEVVSRFRVSVGVVKQTELAKKNESMSVDSESGLQLPNFCILRCFHSRADGVI